MKTCAIWYASQSYISHSRVADDYKKLLEQRYTLANSPDDADIVILHIEPRDYHALYKRFPVLRFKYVISFCVWEASALPVAYTTSLSLVQEVWTCSEYCAGIIRLIHSQVHVIPHVIKRVLSFSVADARAVKRAISYEDSLEAVRDFVSG